MAKVIVIYGTTTGKTERLSESVAEGLRKKSLEVALKNVQQMNTDELMDYDLIILGCSTWGQGELQDDFVDFHDRMESVSLIGKKAAVFGPGNSVMYPDSFCEAVNILQRRLEQCGAQIVAEGLKVDRDVEQALGEAESWGSKIAESL